MPRPAPTANPGRPSFVDVDGSPLCPRRADADFISRRSSCAALSNGIESIFPAAPPGQWSASLCPSMPAHAPTGPPSGAAEPDGRPLDEGTTRLNSTQIAETRERLGATITTVATLDDQCLARRLALQSPGRRSNLLADIVRNPALRRHEIARLRGQHPRHHRREWRSLRDRAAHKCRPCSTAPASHASTLHRSAMRRSCRRSPATTILAAHARRVPAVHATFRRRDTTLARSCIARGALRRWQAPAAPADQALFDRASRPRAHHPGRPAAIAAVSDPRRRSTNVRRHRRSSSLWSRP